MLVRPMKRIWPSDYFSARSNICRHSVGLTNGISPSNTSIKANAPRIQSPTAGLPCGCWQGQRRAGAAAAGAAAAPPLPRMALKKSLDGSTTITSLLPRKLAR